MISSRARVDWAEHVQSIPLLQIVTLVIWLLCLGTGIAGYLLHYRVPAPPKPAEPIQAQLITVDVTRNPAMQPDAAPPTADSTPPPPAPPQAAEIPAAPPLTAVAEYTPKIQFALPVEGPTRTVEPAQAVPARPVRPAPTPAKTPGQAVQHLVFGQGEGAQPAPDYPSDALAAGEEGAVGVRFTVGEDGRVITARAISPSRWPLLNNAAVQVIQNRWRFTRGAARTYDVVMRFKMNR